ncbi:MAG: tyrosine--tRNA ligase [Candidatus Microsaccharimonas sp.]
MSHFTDQDAPIHYADQVSTPETQASVAEYNRSREVVHTALESGEIDAIREVILDELHARRSEDLTGLSTEAQVEKLVSRSHEILPSEELATRISASKETGVPLRVKYGIDPTGSDVHIGHAVPMLILDRMRRMGHHITFIVGDFTAKIGDPSGRVSSRPVLSDEQIAKNMETYTQQIAPLFDMDGVEVVHNGDWLNQYPLNELMGVLSKVSASQTLQRNDFRGRLDSGLTLSELMYPVVMAIDSVKLDTDVEIGGKDQLLNMQMCRTVMDIYGKKPEVIITTDIMEGTDGSGRKMGKSFNNYVGLTQEPTEIFGRVMSIPDTLMEQYFKMITELETSEWDQLKKLMDEKILNPMEVKKILAYDLVHVLHGEEQAAQAETDFMTKFSKKNYAEISDAPELAVEAGTDSNEVIGLVAGMLASIRGKSVSNGEVRRIIGQGGVRVITPEGEVQTVKTPEAMGEIIPGISVKIGKAIIRITDKEVNL